MIEIASIKEEEFNLALALVYFKRFQQPAPKKQKKIKYRKNASRSERSWVDFLNQPAVDIGLISPQKIWERMSQEARDKALSLYVDDQESELLTPTRQLIKGLIELGMTGITGEV